jgi:hypothetical protein
MAANHPNVGHGCVHLPRLKPAIGTIMFSRQILGRLLNGWFWALRGGKPPFDQRLRKGGCRPK